MHRFLLHTLCCGLLLLHFIHASAQSNPKDSTGSYSDKDTLTQAPSASLPATPTDYFSFKPKVPYPKRAALYSGIMPGLGQIYNRQYWKTGIIYAGFAAMGGLLYFNASQYQTYKKAYFSRIDFDPATTDSFSQYTLEDLNLLRRTYRSYTEYTVLAITAGYMLNILDAFVSAHLRTFDMGRDISLHTSPYIDPRGQAGIKLALHF